MNNAAAYLFEALGQGRHFIFVIFRAIKFLLAAVIMMAAASATAATGDILSVSIATNGWQALVTIDSLSTGGTYSMGLGANNSVDAPATPSLILQVASPGFDDVGQPTTITRTVYGTRPMRLPYPNNTLNDESLVSNRLTVKFALSDFVYPGDTATANIRAGLYKQGTSSAAASGIVVTNQSALVSPRVVGNWSWPGWQRITGTNFDLHCVAFHRSGQSGRPVRVVKFWATDQHGNSVTNFVTTPSIDASSADAVPVIEYIGHLPTDGLTQGDAITCNFKAYPWVGPNQSTLDTSDGVNTQPTPLYAPITLLCDKLGTYGVTIAVADVANGNDTSGAAVDSNNFNSTAPPAAFGTLSKAISAIYNYNRTNHARSDAGAGIVYLKAGKYPWLGSTATYGTKPNCWLTITPFPGTASNAVSIASQTGDRVLAARVKLSNVKLTTVDWTFDGIETLWFDRCYIDTVAPNNQWIQDVRSLYVTRNIITNWGDPASSSSGIRPIGVQAMSPVVVRGNTIIGPLRKVMDYTVLGNLYSGPTNQSLSFRMADDESSAIPAPVNCVFAYNRIYRFENSGGVFVCNGGAQQNLHGVAIVQNMLENVGNGNIGLMWQGADGSTNEIDNVIVWQNTVAGQRMNCAYNDVGTNAYLRLNWSLKQNVMSKHAIKADLFDHPPEGKDGRRIGNWSVLFGVGAAGNMYAETSGMTAAGSFLSEFAGLNSFQPAGTTPSGNWLQFENPACFDGVNVGTGGGDYHLRTVSPAYNLGRELLLPYDLDGRSRSPADPPGAYAVTQRPAPPSQLRFAQ